MSLEKEILTILTPIWYSKNNLDELIKKKDVFLRGEKIKEPLQQMFSYQSKKEFTINGFILDNFMGALQHYLIGFDLYSVPLSSKAMEVAILYKTADDPSLERNRGFFDIVNALIISGVLRSEEAVRASKVVVDRRNFLVHDAIFQQALKKTTFKCFKTK